MNINFIDSAIDHISNEYYNGHKDIFYLNNDNIDRRRYKNKINGYKMRRSDFKNAIVNLITIHNFCNKNDIINHIINLNNNLLILLNNSETTLWFYISQYEPRLSYKQFKQKLNVLNNINKDHVFLLILFTTYQWVKC